MMGLPPLPKPEDIHLKENKEFMTTAIDAYEAPFADSICDEMFQTKDDEIEMDFYERALETGEEE